jgi:KDO2-lipid IV(A) lauroyltransferase
LNRGTEEGSRDASELSLARFWTPRYWPTWVVLGALHAAARVPFAWQLAIGRRLGRALMWVRRSKQRTVRRNLEICFPELTVEERDALLVRHFEAVGISFLEMGAGWFTPIDELLKRVTITGREHLDRALATKRGVLLVSAHFTPIEVCFAVLESLVSNCSCMYRTQRNAMMDVLIRRGRARFASAQIPRDNVRMLLRHLHDNRVVAYMPDQTYLGKQSALVPFFGEPALTNIATSKLAALSGATMLPYFFRRLPGTAGYRIDIGPPVAGFPSGDPVVDARAFFARLESSIRLAPEQYLWLYKKFKGRPAPYPDPYAAEPEAP